MLTSAGPLELATTDYPTLSMIHPFPRCINSQMHVMQQEKRRLAQSTTHVSTRPWWPSKVLRAERLSAIRREFLITTAVPHEMDRILRRKSQSVRILWRSACFLQSTNSIDANTLRSKNLTAYISQTCCTAYALPINDLFGDLRSKYRGGRGRSCMHYKTSLNTSRSDRSRAIHHTTIHDIKA
jgi:hypothetical protein